MKIIASIISGKLTKTQKNRLKKYLDEGYDRIQAHIMVKYYRSHSLIYFLERLFKNETIYACAYVNRDTSYNQHNNIIKILTFYNIEYEVGNSGPRGGYTKTYIKLKL